MKSRRWWWMYLWESGRIFQVKKKKFESCIILQGWVGRAADPSIGVRTSSPVHCKIMNGNVLVGGERVLVGRGYRNRTVKIRGWSGTLSGTSLLSCDKGMEDQSNVEYCITDRWRPRLFIDSARMAWWSLKDSITQTSQQACHLKDHYVISTNLETLSDLSPFCSSQSSVPRSKQSLSQNAQLGTSWKTEGFDGVMAFTVIG